LPKDLLFLSKEDYGKVFTSERLDDYNLQVRFDHMEKRRQERLRIVVEERFKLIEMEKAGIDPFAAHGSFKGTAKGTTAGLLSKEANMIEKMKRNQRKEVEQMMQYELELQTMRQKNEEKAQQQAEREHKRQLSVEQKRKEAEAKRLEYEEDKKRKAEEAEKERKRLEEETFLKEKTKEAEQKSQESMKRKTGKQLEEQQKKKQEEFKLATEKIIEQQRLEVLKKKEEMETKEQDRKRKMDEERQFKLQEAKAKQEEHKAKIEVAKSKNEQNMSLKRQQYNVKEKVAEEKKKMFEEVKAKKREENEAKFQKKEELIEKAKTSNQATLLKKKDDYFQKQLQNQEKLKIQEEELRREIEQKKKEEEENQKKREEKRKSNLSQLDSRKQNLLKIAEDKSMKMRSASEKRDAERALKNNLEQMKKLDKLEQVKRNERKKEWERNQLMGKILNENEKIEYMKSEKKNLLHEKADVKAKIDRDKEELAKKFQLVKEGKLNPHALLDGSAQNGENAIPKTGSMRGTANPQSRSRQGLPPGGNKVSFATESVEGVNSAAPAKPKQQASDRPSLPKMPPVAAKNKEKNASKTYNFDLKPGESLEVATIRLKEMQGKEMLRVLEEESKEKNNRDAELLVVTDLMERKRLSKIHEVQEARAKERILQIMKRHEEETDSLKAKVK
jgi:hypothetical protein